MKLANHPHFVELFMDFWSRANGKTFGHISIDTLKSCSSYKATRTTVICGCVHLKSRLLIICSLDILSYVRWLLFPQFVHRQISVCLSKVDVKVYCCFIIFSYSIQCCVVVIADFSDFLIAHLQLGHQLLSMYLIFIE